MLTMAERSTDAMTLPVMETNKNMFLKWTEAKEWKFTWG